MSAFSFSLHNSRRCRFYASAAVAALIASVVVGAMEIYVSAPTDAAVAESQPVTAPTVANVIEQYLRPAAICARQFRQGAGLVDPDQDASEAKQA
jgi:hypothetical protein